LGVVEEPILVLLLVLLLVFLKGVLGGGGEFVW
jgi:hypothetical protein